MLPGKTARLPLLAFLFTLVPPASGVDFYIRNVPPLTSTVTPQIDNISTLKRYHLRDLEQAEDLDVSCFLGGTASCITVLVGDPPVFMMIHEDLPTSIQVEFSLINSASEVLRSVTSTYNVEWTEFFATICPAAQDHYSQILQDTLPLSGLDLEDDIYRVVARVDPNDNHEESDETNNSRASEDNFRYRIYSGDLLYGSILTRLSTLEFTGICLVPTVPLANTSQAEWTHDWGTTVFNPASACYSLQTDADGFSIDLLAPASPVTVIPELEGETPSGLHASLLGVELDNTGGSYDGLSVELPEEISVHRLEDSMNPLLGPEPRGEGVLIFNQGGTFTDIFDILTPFVSDAPRFYHAYTHPFSVFSATTQFVLGDTNPLQLMGIAALHNHFSRYASLNTTDPRAFGNQAKAFPLNDIYYMGLDFTNPNGTISTAGLNLPELGFGTPANGFLSRPRTSFPQGDLYFGAHQIAVVDSQIQSQQVPIDRFEMDVRRVCPDGNCGDYVNPRHYTAEMVGGTAYRTADGALSAPFEMLGADTRWGKFLGSNGTFQRDDSSLPGVFYLPGYHAPGTVEESGRTVSQVLLGSRQYDGPGDTPQTLSPLREGGPSANSNRGNGFYAGLTMGPERLAGLEEGAGAVLADDQDIRFNGNANYDSFEITDYTKYFLRPSGVTGVFNTTFMGTLNIYGYDIDFRRFAFRQVYNELDGKTFLDGSLDIPYPCDITVSFLELDLTCSGDLGSGVVDSEPEADWRYPDGEDNDGDTLVDEGNGVLAYWKTPISINGMAFVATGNDPDPCVNNENKELELITLDDLNGIDTTLTMRAIYPNDGRLKEQQITASVDTVYDQPMMSEEPGFAIRSQFAYLNQLNSYPPQHEGFWNITGLSDVPLFNDLDVHLHLLNPEVEGLSLPDETYDIFIGKNDTANDANFNGLPDSFGSSVGSYRDLLDDEEEKPESGDPRPRAKYSWPSAGVFDLNYALTYNRTNGTDKPQYLGVEETYELFNEAFPIITVASVPDFINPEKTKFSFGASADVARALNFQANLVSLLGLDDFLHNVLGVDGNFSLENILGNVLNVEEFIKKITGGDLSAVLGLVIDKALDSGPLENTFGNFAEAVGIVDRIPQEISIRTVGVLETFEAQLLNQVTGGAHPLGGASGLLDDLYNEYAAYLTVPPNVLADGANGIGIAAGIPHTLPQQEAIYTELENLRTRLNQIEQVLIGLNNEIDAAKGQVNNLEDDLGDGLADAANFLSDINNNILSGGGSLGQFTSLSGNPIIERVDEIKGKVQEVLNAIKAVDLGVIASVIDAAASAAGSSIDTSIINDADNTIKDLVASLEEVVEQVESILQSSYTSMPDVFDEAKDLLDTIVNNLNLVQAQIASITGQVVDVLETAQDQVGLVRSQVQALRELLEVEPPQPNAFFESEFSTYNSLVNLGQEKLDDFSAELAQAIASQAPGSLLQTFAGGGTPDFAKFFINGFDDLLCLPLQEANQFIAGEIAMILETALQTIPAPQLDDIKQIIKGAILNSAPVQALNESFYELISPISQVADEIALQLTQSINQLLQEAIAALAEGLDSLLDSITSDIGVDFDTFSARIDGWALVNTDELERLHIEAEFSYGTVPDKTSYNAALDVTAWNAENGKGACVDDGGEGKLDVLISSHDVPIQISGGQTSLREVALGFTLDKAIPIGFFGRCYLGGEINFEAIAIRNLGLEVGVGLIENYLGATAAGRFESYTLNIIAFYFGKTCDFGVLERLDPQVAGFIGEKVPLIGAYVRGAASIPIYNISCLFTLGAGADIGAWYFHPDFGGLVGGSIYGKLACLAALRGGVLTIGAKVGDEFYFQGTGWGGAGIGFCSPEDWNSVADVRDDDWCLTGDATFGAEYTGGWEIIGPDVNCCD